MKYPEYRMSLEAAMPLSDSVLSWLGHQLEVRGIDSVIYTRYIISLLQQDVADIDIADREELWDIKAESKKSKDKKDGKKKPVSEEERRKTAAVECLLSLSDEANDIESLVEELYIRLKETKSNQDYFTPLTIHTKEKSKYLSEVQDAPKRTETQDPAERYYAAFPALPGDGSPAQMSPSSDDNIWRKTRKSGSLAGEASESKGNSPRNVKDKENKLAANEVQAERENVDDSEVQSCSPAANDKRKKPSKSDGNHKSTQSGNSKKKVTAPKVKVVGKSKAVRFLSWPQSEKGKEEPAPYQKALGKNCTQAETEEKKYCHMVEQMLKEMLMTGNKQIETYADFSVFNYYQQEFDDGTLTNWFREDSQSPEFAENDDWYTQPLEHIFYTPVSQTKRLYKRHSYPPSSVTLEHQIELNAIVTEQLLCLKRTSQEYLPEDVFEAEEDPCNNEDTVSPGMTDHSFGKADAEEKSQEQTSKHVFAYTIDMPESAGKAEIGRFEDNGDDTDGFPAWFTYDQSYASNIPFAFDQSDLTTDGEKAEGDYDVFATMFKLPNPLPDLDYLVPASDTSSTVSSVEKGYFSDVTETSFLFDTSQHGSPFPDVLLLMDYGEEQDNGDGSSSAVGLKGSRLESLFETSKHESTRNAAADSEDVPIDAEERQEFSNIAVPFLCTEENFVPCGTRNMLPNGARLEETRVVAAHAEMLDSSGTQLNELELHEQMSTLQLSESTSDEDEMDESACFPSDLFSSFSSVGEGPNALVQPEESDHDIFDFESDQWKTDCSPSVFLHLSPFERSGSCWQNKVLLHNYGERLSFESLFWPSTMNERKSETLKTVLDGATAEITIGAQFRGELWQLWNVNGQKKIPDLWQEEGKSNIWNSCLNLSCYVSNDFEKESSLSSKDEVTFAEIINDDVLGLQFLEEINGLGYMGHRCERSVSESDLQHMSSTLFYEFTKPNLDISYELIPSENSAFQGVIPKQLHHVQSAPNLRCLMSMLQEEDDLQLTVGAASNIESPAEHLYFSSKTHFRPIQTPVATPDEDEFNPQDLFGGMKDTTGTPYQHFVSPGEEESKFRPKFKLQKDFDKYIQTGRSLDEADDYERLVPVPVEETKDCQTELIEELVVGCVLEDKPESKDDWYSTKEQKGSSMHERDGISKCPAETVKEKLVLGLCESLNDLHMTKNSSTTGDQDFANQSWEQSGVDEESRWDGQKIKEMNLSEKLKDYHDIWSSGYEMDLHPFSVESECVFLPCTVDEQRLCKSQVTTNEDNEDLDPETTHQSDELYFYYLDSYPEVDSYILSTTCPEDCPEQQGYDVSGLVPIPHQAVYSSDLEKQWLDSKAGKATQKLHRFKIKKDSSKRKPCSFFLEGNCKRSDCKFSHDLSSITCRFWEEGLCFKGQLCPFFHGYQSYSEVDSDHSERTRRKFEFKNDDFPELDTRCKYKQRHEKDLHSKKISRKRQAHKEFLKKTLSSRKKIKHAPKQQVKTAESSNF